MSRTLRTDLGVLDGFVSNSLNEGCNLLITQGSSVPLLLDQIWYPQHDDLKEKKQLKKLEFECLVLKINKYKIIL